MEKNQKNLMLSLIKDDLLNHKLVSGLTKLGLDASPYTLHLSDTIFYLFDLNQKPDQEELMKRYFELSKKVEEIGINEEEYTNLDELTQELFVLLVETKNPE